MSKKISEAFNIKGSQSTDAPEQQVGLDRIGSDEISENFGVTLILGSIILALLIILVLIAIYISRSEERKKWLKDKIFFNPFVRYAFLNALKLNMAAMVAFKRQSNDLTAIIVAILLFVGIHTVPFVLAKL